MTFRQGHDPPASDLPQLSLEHIVRIQDHCRMLKLSKSMAALYDLVGQLELLLQSKIVNNSPGGGGKRDYPAELDGLLSDNESLLKKYRRSPTWKRILSTSKHKDKVNDLIIRLERILLQMSEAPQLSEAPTSVEALQLEGAPQQSTMVARQSYRASNSTARILFACRILEKALSPIPLAGSFLAAACGVVSVVLERRQIRGSNHRTLLELHERINGVARQLCAAGFCVADPQNKVLRVRKDMPHHQVQQQCMDVNSLAREVERLLTYISRDRPRDGQNITQNHFSASLAHLLIEVHQLEQGVLISVSLAAVQASSVHERKSNIQLFSLFFHLVSQ